MTALPPRVPGSASDGEAYGTTASVEPAFSAVMVLALATPMREAQARERTLNLRWMETRARFVDRQVAGHQGQIFRGTSEGLVAGFRRAIDAVRCAIELQRDIPVANSAAPDRPPIEICIGIDVCHLEASLDELTAESKEAMAGLRDLAGAGGIAVSGEIEGQIRGTADIDTQPLGPLPRRRSSRPIYAHRVAFRRLGDQAPSRRKMSQRQMALAILPFRSGTTDRRDDYFAEGIAEEIVTALAGSSDLIVVSRASGPAPADYADLRVVGRELGVNYVVTGTAGREGNVVSIDVQVAETEAATVLWAKSYKFPLSELFDLQEEMALRIARAVAPTVGQAELRRSDGKRPDSLDAYDLVLRASYRMYRLDRAEFATARDLLDRAIATDPGWGTPYALLAEWHTLDLGQGYCENENVAMNELIRLALSAVERNKSDARALALLGHCRSWLFRDYVTALDLFEQAFAAAPNSAFAWGWSSPTCSYLGDGATAVDHAEYALRLSPLSPHAYFFRSALSLGHYTKGDYEEAVRWGRRAMAAHPTYTSNLRFLAASLAACGRIQDARAVGRALLALRPGFSVNELLSRYSYKDSKRTAVMAEHLRLAGLPE